MKYPIFLILIVTLATGCLTRKKKNLPLTEAEAIAVIQQFDSGWSGKNLSQVEAVLAPSYVYFTQSGGVFSRDSLVQTAGSPSYSLSRMERTAYEVYLLGNVAVVSTRWKGVGIYRGRPFDEDQRCSITVVKNKGKVEILSEHCTPIKTLPLLDSPGEQ